MKTEYVTATEVIAANKRLAGMANKIWRETQGASIWFYLNRTAMGFVLALRVLSGERKFHRLNEVHRSMVANTPMLGLNREV